jgi:motility quorum-sensing regulator/GCU-specific mRNA interferase toxin
MEKFTSHCDLSTVKAMVQAEKVRMTTTASIGAEALGLDFDGVIDIVMELTINDFYKSMTSYNDHRVWQDVYRPTTKVGKVYLKLIVINDVLIVSFKEL